MTTATITVKRSKFHAVFVPVTSEEEARKVVARRRGKVKKAVHHCWALRLIDPAGQLIERARDDGEVGRPGHRILEVLRHDDLQGLLVVSRIFGGIKLGPAGVGRAFRDAAREVVGN